MSARDDYPVLWKEALQITPARERRHAFDEIDRLRAELAAAAVRAWELNNEIDRLTADRNRLARLIQGGVYDNRHSGCCSE